MLSTFAGVLRQAKYLKRKSQNECEIIEYLITLQQITALGIRRCLFKYRVLMLF